MVTGLEDIIIIRLLIFGIVILINLNCIVYTRCPSMIIPILKYI